MEKPLVSFIIPYYNVPLPLLRECVASIEAVDADKEVIIINDGCDACLDEFAGSCIVRKIEHCGLAAVRNYGIEISNGEYIQFVDSDDKLITPNYQQIINVVKKERPDMLYYHFTSHGSKEETVSYCAFCGAEYMSKHNIFGSAWHYVFRRSILGDLRFTSGIVHEDEEFTPQLIVKSNKFYFTKSKGYYYRTTQGSIMTKKNEEHITKRLNDLLYVILSLNDKNETLADELSRKAINRRTHQLCMDYIYNIITLGRRKELKNRLQDLRENSLYPLPLKFYTWKYYLAALITHL